MIREYIFCSVIESPQMATMSPFFKSSPAGFGAGRGWKFSKAASVEFGWRVCPPARQQASRARVNRNFERMIVRLILGLLSAGVKPRVHITNPRLTKEHPTANKRQ